MTDKHFAALGLFSNLLATETLGRLVQRKVLSLEDAREIIDRCSVNLEERMAGMDAESAEVLQLAHGLFEAALDQLSRQS